MAEESASNSTTGALAQTFGEHNNKKWQSGRTGPQVYCMTEEETENPEQHQKRTKQEMKRLQEQQAKEGVQEYLVMVLVGATDNPN